MLTQVEAGTGRAGLFTSSLIRFSLSSFPLPNLGELSGRVGRGSPGLSSSHEAVGGSESFSPLCLFTLVLHGHPGVLGAWQLGTVGQLHLQGPRSPSPGNQLPTTKPRGLCLECSQPPSSSPACFLLCLHCRPEGYSAEPQTSNLGTTRDVRDA